MLVVLVPVSLLLLSLSQTAQARGGARAFPMRSENFAIENFKNVNPQIEWDPTNYLVDKSGQFAHCAEFKRGYEETFEFTPEGQSMAVVYDYVEGPGMDADTVNQYIIGILDGWMVSRQYHSTIRSASRFGCSVRPGCPNGASMVTTVACLFSPGRYQAIEPEPSSSGYPPPIRATTTRRPRPRPTTTTAWPEPPFSPDPLKQKGLAFTPEQYDMAEKITGKVWDRSHFLENLSGYEIKCSMMNDPYWQFTDAKDLAKEYGIDVMGVKGEARNYGSTQRAMEEILEDFTLIQTASRVGCSVIPDCYSYRGDLGREMWVIVACIYEEPTRQ